MKTHRLLGAACAALLAAAPAAAQGTIAIGETVRGELSAADPMLFDSTHYDVWRFEGTAGRRVVVTLRSAEFDTFLAVGGSVTGDCEDCAVDDDGAGGTDSRVRMTLPRSGTYEIRANALFEGEMGVYTLTLEDAGEAPPLAPRGEIGAGQTVSGELDEDDLVADDGSFFEIWTYRGGPGEQIVITLRSGDFDAYLGWGRIVDGRWEELDADDDGAGEGTDSRLEVRLGDDGVYHVRASSLFPDDTGAYTLTVERQ
jgi:hypothetical protein